MSKLEITFITAERLFSSMNTDMRFERLKMPKSRKYVNENCFEIIADTEMLLMLLEGIPVANSPSMEF